MADTIKTEVPPVTDGTNEMEDLLKSVGGDYAVTRFQKLSRADNQAELLIYLKGCAKSIESDPDKESEIVKKYLRQIESWFLYAEKNEFRGEKALLKERDREVLRKSIDISSSSNKTFFVSYLSILLYLAVTVSGVSDEQFLLANPVKLPWLNINIPLAGFFLFAPLILLATHFNLLFNLNNHFQGLRKFMIASGEADMQEFERFQLVPFIFNSLLLNEVKKNQEAKSLSEKTWNIFSFALAYFVLNILPACVFAFIQIRFSDYQSMQISSWHYFLLLMDIGISVYFLLTLTKENIEQPIENKEQTKEKKEQTKAETSSRFKVTIPVLGNAMLFLFILLGTSFNMFYLLQVYNLRGETEIPILEESFKSSLRFRLFPRIEVRGKNLVQSEPSDLVLLGGLIKGDGNLEEFKEQHTKGIDVSERNLVYALIDNCTITNANFKSSHLEGAVFNRSNVQKANFHLSHINGAEPGNILKDLRGIDKLK